MFCTNCGSELPDDARFCETCGTQVELDADPIGESGSEKAPEPQAPAEQPQVSTIAAPPAQATATQDQQSKRSPGVIAGIVAGACAALAAIVVVVTMFMGSGSFKPVKIDSATFPDEKLRNVVFTFDTDGDGTINEDEMAAISLLQLDGVADYSGLQRLAGLDTLVVSNPATSDIVLPDNTTIETISFKGNGSGNVNTVSFGNNQSVKSVNMTGAGATGVDASGCLNLQVFEDSDDGLRKVTLPPSSELQKIVVNDDVELVGIENTAVKEHWIPTSLESNVYNSFTVGGNPERATLEFDANGCISEMHYLTRGDELDCQYRYDDEGRVVGMTSTSPRDKYDMTVTYDGQGRILTVSSSEQDHPYKITYSYGEGTAPVSSHEVGTDYRGDSYDLDREFTYGANGLLASMTMRQDGSQPAETFIEYDGNGLVSSVLVSDKTQPDFGFEATRDDEGRITQVTSTFSSRPSYKYHLFYDADGRLTNATGEVVDSSSSNIPILSTAFTYDANGLLTSWVMTCDNDGSIIEENEVGYTRILATDEEYAAHDALKAFDIADIFYPFCNMEFFDPMSCFVGSKMNFLFSGCPSFFVNEK